MAQECQPIGKGVPPIGTERNCANAVENRFSTRIDKKKLEGIQELKITHSHGNITVKESKTSEVSLEIHYYDNRNRKATTDIDIKKNTLSIKSNNSKKNITHGAKIDYVISMPAKNTLEIELEYGNLSATSLSEAIIKGK